MTVVKNMQTDKSITEIFNRRFKIEKALEHHIPQLVLDAKKMFLTAFSEAYKEAAYFTDYVEGAFTNKQFKAEFGEENTDFWIVWDQNKIAGYTKLKLDILPPDMQMGKGLEIKRFYLHEAYHGSGLAQYIMEHCLDQAHQHSCSMVWLGVWPQNHKAIKFYKKYDFEIDGEVKFVLGGVTEWDWVMKKYLIQD